MSGFLTVKDVAKFCSKSVQAVYGWIDRGWIKPIVLQLGGNKYYQFTVDSLFAFYNGQISRAEIEERVKRIRQNEQQEESICKCRTDS